MNCMSSKICKRKEQMICERERAEEEKYLNSLSKEERAVYLKSKEEKRRRVLQFLAVTMAISAGAYCQLPNAKIGGKGGEQKLK